MISYALPTLGDIKTESTSASDMIIDNDPAVERHISVPRDMSQLSCSSFTAGIVEAVLDGLTFVCFFGLLFLCTISLFYSLLELPPIIHPPRSIRTEQPF